MEYAPYGLMPEEWNSNTELPRPQAFRNADGTATSPAQWAQWLNDTADDLGSFLWPRFDGSQWIGSAKSEMDALTRADLTLMASLSPQLKQTIPGTTTTHERLFLAEDPKPPNLAGFLHYAPQAPVKLAKQFDSWLLQGGGDMARPVSLNLKRRMQRPRPYQVALQLGIQPVLAYRAASSATSPAMVSGHCIQGSMALANVVVSFESLYGPMEATMLGLVQRYFIDTGDRRVFAGVHYPTDNISSWFVALRLCRRVYAEAEADRARQVLWSAIQSGEVFIAIQQAVTNDPKSPFAQPLERLRTEALGSGGVVDSAQAVTAATALPKRRRKK
jgi:hypothetical protein